MSKDTVELIIKKSINLCCQPDFRYISSLVIVPNAPFSQSLHIYIHALATIICPNYPEISVIKNLTTI